jgi:hypothetical protein
MPTHGKFFDCKSLTPPSREAPLSLVYAIAFITDMLAILLATCFGIHLNPVLSRTSVLATSVDNYYDVSKAR